jgi:hypothetical protein
VLVCADTEPRRTSAACSASTNSCDPYYMRMRHIFAPQLTRSDLLADVCLLSLSLACHPLRAQVALSAGRA